MFYTYILKSKHKDWCYIGATADLKKRLQKHNQRWVRSTQFYAPLDLIYYEAYVTLSLARKREYELKTNNQQKEILFRRLGL